MKEDILVSVAAIISDDFGNLEYLLSLADILEKNYAGYEIVLIHNGPASGGGSNARAMVQQCPNARLIELVGKCDEDMVYFAALDTCIGDVVVLFNLVVTPVDLMPRIVAGVVNGVDVVLASPSERQYDFSFYVLLSRAFYRFANFLSASEIEFDRTNLSCYSRAAINAITKHQSQIRNLKLLRSHLGLRTETLLYQAAEKPHKAVTKRYISHVVFARIEQIFSLSSRPLRVIAAACFFVGFLDVFYILYVIVSQIFVTKVAAGWTSTSLFLGIGFGLLFIALGIISVYLNIIMREVQQRPPYIISGEWNSNPTVVDQFTKKNVVQQ
ncbi:MAG: hypothetical protein Q7T46_09620 [Polaromonas sp.]|nr:hypothetical protein [Polaromonas sp.]